MRGETLFSTRPGVPEIHPKIRAFQFFSVKILVDGFNGDDWFIFKGTSADDLFRRPLEFESRIDVEF